MRPVILSQIGLAASAVAAILAPAAASAQSSAIRDTALSPDKFTFGLTGSGSPGEWRVVDDAGALNGRALAQLSKDRTDYRFPLAIYKSASAQNLDVVIHFKPVSGDVDRAGGVAIRLTTPNDYYVVRANALEDNVRFYRVIKGKREQIAGANVKVTSGSWHSLGLRAQGSHFTITFDGKQLFTANDTTFAEGDRVALWTKADSVTFFDWLELTVPPKPASFLNR